MKISDESNYGSSFWRNSVTNKTVSRLFYELHHSQDVMAVKRGVEVAPFAAAQEKAASSFALDAAYSLPDC
jgi:hypothetical protein